MSFGTFFGQSSVLEKAFPTPEYLRMPAVGIDISDYSLKYVLLTQNGDEVQLEAYGKQSIPMGTVESGNIQKPEVLVEMLKKLRREHDFDFVHLSVPEEHAYLFQTDVALQDGVDPRQVLEFSLKENVPIAPEEATFDFEYLHKIAGKEFVNVAVYPTVELERYIAVVEEAGLTPLSIEVEGQATARALVRSDHEGAVFVIDTGRSEASLSIVKNGTVVFTATLETGGDNLTQALVKKLSISYQEAEALKREQGFVNGRESKAVYQALLPVVTTLKDAIQKHHLYWQMHSVWAEHEDQSIDSIILTGGNANIRGLPEFFESALELPVQIGNVWENVYDFDRQVPPIVRSKSYEYATAIGLALRGVSRNTDTHA